MRVTIFVTEDAMQFNLEPENEHEKDFVSILKKYSGSAEIHQGVNISECQGNYLRNFGKEELTLAITVRKKEPDLGPGDCSCPK